MKNARVTIAIQNCTTNEPRTVRVSFTYAFMKNVSFYIKNILNIQKYLKIYIKFKQKLIPL